MNIAPMLADFTIRLAFGLAVSLLVDLLESGAAGFLPDGGAGDSRATGPRRARSGAGGRPGLGALGPGRRRGHGLSRAVAWGLGLPRFGTGASVLVALVPRLAGWRPHIRLPLRCGFSTAASRLSSGFLLGSTLTAMLLGHHYLTAPAMSIEPLKRIVALWHCPWCGARGARRIGNVGAGDGPYRLSVLPSILKPQCSWLPGGAWASSGPRSRPT